MSTDELVRDRLQQLARTIRTTRPPISVIVDEAERVGTVTVPRSQIDHEPADSIVQRSMPTGGPRWSRTAAFAAAITVTVAAAAVLTQLDRAAAPSSPTATSASNAPTTASAPTTITAPAAVVDGFEQWAPVHLADGLVPWYELGGVAAGQFHVVERGSSAANLYCTHWSAADDGSVSCESVHIEGLLPAVTYGDDRGRSIGISTIHADITPTEYATMISVGKDTGYDSPGLEPTSIDVGERTGQLIDTAAGEPYAVRRVTVELSPGVLVAVESMGFTIDELVEFTASLAPADDPRETVPLLLETIEGDGLSGQLLGGVIDNEVCALSTLWFNDGPVRCELLRGRDLLVVPPEGGSIVAGLVSADVASINLTYADGTTSNISPTPQPIGQAQSFAAPAAAGTLAVVSVTALDHDDNELSTIDLDPGTVVPTTYFVTTPESS